MRSADRLDLDSLRNAVKPLESGLATLGDQDWLAQQPAPVREVVAAGVIQNFEIVYELSVKTLRRQLERDLPSTAEIERGGFRHLLRLGGEAGLIEEVANWFEYRKMRNITSHTYDPAKANTVLAGIPGFLRDARLFLSALEQRNG